MSPAALFKRSKNLNRKKLHDKAKQHLDFHFASSSKQIVHIAGIQSRRLNPLNNQVRNIFIEWMIGFTLVQLKDGTVLYRSTFKNFC